MDFQNIKVGQILLVGLHSNWGTQWRGKKIKVIQKNTDTGDIDIMAVDFVNQGAIDRVYNNCGIKGLEPIKKLGKAYYPDWL